MRKTILTALALFLTGIIANAQEATSQDGSTMSTILIVINIVLFLFAVMLVNLLSHAIKQLKSSPKAGEIQLTWWEKFAALKSSKSEQDLLLDEDYDGIVELDNPTPPWFNFIFYTSIIFAVLYIINYHVVKYSNLQEEEYIAEVKSAEIAKAEYLKLAGNLIDENNVTALKETAALTDGEKIYTQNCAVCHGKTGEGLVGPNLTDEYWIHGNGINNIFKTIKYGVPQKGMVPWQNSLTGTQIQQVASYIITLEGTNPPNAKQPQGEKVGSTQEIKDTTSVALLVK